MTPQEPPSPPDQDPHTVPDHSPAPAPEAPVELPPPFDQAPPTPPDHSPAPASETPLELLSPDQAPPPPREPERYPFWNYLDVVLFLGMALPSLMMGGLAARAIFGFLYLHYVPRVAELLSAQLIVYLVLFGFLWLLFRARYDRPFWRSLAWTRSRIPFLWIIISGFLTASLVVVASNLIQTPTTPNPMSEMLEGRTSIILMAIFGVTVGPLFEELGFRGFLQPLLVRTFGAAAGILLTAIPFGILHWQEYGNSWRHVVVITLAGAAFGVMRHVAGSTRAAVIMHASYNGLFFLALLRKDLPHGW
jgi:membrane protease YdiL (CAAX protease family)